MPEIIIRNFKYGLDTRRESLTSIAGTLVDLTNAHITQGGEIEKRLAFVRTALPANTFGLESTENGLITFGSIADPGGWPIGGVDAFQRLQHPAVIDGATYDGAYHAMTAVKWSTTYDGKAYVCAEFADTNTFLYYDGALVRESRDGIVLYGDTTTTLKTTLGNALAEALNGVYDSANTVNLPVGATANNDTIIKTLSSIGYAGVTSLGLDSAATGTAPSVTLTFVDTLSTTFRARSGTTATLTLGAGHGMDVDDEITVSGVGVAAYNGNFTIISITSTTISYTIAAGAEATTADVGGSVKVTYTDMVVTIKAPPKSSVLSTGSYETLSSNQAGAVIVGGYVPDTDRTTFLAAIAASVNTLYGVYGYLATSDATTLTITAPSEYAPWGPPLRSILVEYQHALSGNTSVPTKRIVGISTLGTSNFSTGSVYTAGYGDQLFETFTGTWSVGDTWSFALTVTSTDFTIGYGRITAISPNFGFVFGQRAYLTNNVQFNFSAVDDLTSYNEQATSAGFIGFSSQYGSQDAVQSFAPYQGKLAVFGRRTIQIWQTDAAVANFALQQTLANAGTVAPFSTQALGELDVFYLSDSGIRSLRARQTSLNAFVEDLGSPIDSIIHDVLVGLTDVEKASACSVVEPTSSRYWLYLDGTIYVLSYFTSNKIVAWSKYEPTYSTATLVVTFSGVVSGVTFAASCLINGVTTAVGTSAAAATNADAATKFAAAINALTATTGFSAVANSTSVTVTLPGNGVFAEDFSITVTGTGTATLSEVGKVLFVPQKFVVHEGQVFARSSDAILSYGGVNKQTYDRSVVVAELPWLDHEKPTMFKQGQEVDIGLIGKWQLEMGMDPYSATLDKVVVTGSASTPASETDSSYDKQTIPFVSNGTHFKFKAKAYPENLTKCRLSLLALKYK